MNRPALSIIIPAYQEAKRIERSLTALAAYLSLHDHTDTEVIVVVADSPDGTARLASGKAPLFTQFRVVPAGPRAGKGRDVRVGMIEARGAYKLFMDADLSTPLENIETVRRLIEDKPEVIIGVRDLTRSHAGLRKVLSSTGNLLVRYTLLPDIEDTQCGFKAFSAEAAEELFRRQTILKWGFDMEILAIARMLGYHIAQIEVPDWSDEPDGTFGAVSFAPLETLMELATIIWRRWTGQYRHKNYTYTPFQP